MANWKRKLPEEKKDDEAVSDPRVQSYRNDNERVADAVKKQKIPDEPKALEDTGRDRVDEDKFYNLSVPVSGRMLLRLQEVGPTLGFVDEGEVVREGLRRILYP